MYGDFLEALIGGIYLEKGYEKTKEFVLKNIIDKKTKSIPKQEDYKGRLIYLLNKENKKLILLKLTIGAQTMIDYTRLSL